MVQKEKKQGGSGAPRGRPRKNALPSEFEQKLVENMISLQKVHTDLAEKFDGLAKEISGLLALFEVTAKSFAKHTPLGEYEKDKEFLDKIDKLLDQNKVLAKGLTLMEERLRERVYGSQPLAPPQVMPQQQPMQQPANLQPGSRPLPRF